MNRIACTFVLAALASLFPVIAYAVPVNDNFSAATTISTLPFADTVNTGDSTTAPNEPSCAGIGHTIWYRITPRAAMRVEANTFGSDYDTTLSVYQAQPGGLLQIACNDDMQGGVQSRVRFEVLAGQTYWIMVGSYGDTSGGNLVFAVQVSPVVSPLQIRMTLGSLRFRRAEVRHRDGAGHADVLAPDFN